MVLSPVGGRDFCGMDTVATGVVGINVAGIDVIITGGVVGVSVVVLGVMGKLIEGAALGETMVVGVGVSVLVGAIDAEGVALSAI